MAKFGSMSEDFLHQDGEEEKETYDIPTMKCYKGSLCSDFEDQQEIYDVPPVRYTISNDNNADYMNFKELEIIPVPALPPKKRSSADLDAKLGISAVALNSDLSSIPWSPVVSLDKPKLEPSGNGKRGPVAAPRRKSSTDISKHPVAAPRMSRLDEVAPFTVLPEMMGKDLTETYYNDDLLNNNSLPVTSYSRTDLEKELFQSDEKGVSAWNSVGQKVPQSVYVNVGKVDAELNKVKLGSAVIPSMDNIYLNMEVDPKTSDLISRSTSKQSLETRSEQSNKDYINVPKSCLNLSRQASSDGAGINIKSLISDCMEPVGNNSRSTNVSNGAGLSSFTANTSSGNDKVDVAFNNCFYELLPDEQKAICFEVKSPAVRLSSEKSSVSVDSRSSFDLDLLTYSPPSFPPPSLPSALLIDFSDEITYESPSFSVPTIPDRPTRQAPSPPPPPVPARKVGAETKTEAENNESHALGHLDRSSSLTSELNHKPKTKKKKVPTATLR